MQTNNRDFLEQLNMIIDARVREKGEFDKRVFYTITSLFAFSIALSQFIGKPIYSSWILVLSWIFNILALIAHLLGYWFVDKAINFKRKLFLKQSIPTEEMLSYLVGTKKSNWDKTSEFLDNTSFALLLCAIISIAVFSYLNLISS